MSKDIYQEQEARIVQLINTVISDFNKDIGAIGSQPEYERATNSLIQLLLEAFKREFEQINDHQLYKNLFLGRVRAKQDEYLHKAEYLNFLSDVKQLHGQSPKTQTFFESILLHCANNNRNDVNADVLYLVNLSAVWDGWLEINGYHLKADIMQEIKSDKRTLTPEQKNLVLKTLIEKEDIGTLDGEEIAKSLGANTKYVMALIKDLERREFIEYIGMARYYFQVNVTPEGIDFFNGGGFINEQESSQSFLGSHILNAASFGDNVNIIFGSGNVQNVNNNVVKGDFAALRRTLERNDVSNDDINELENIIDNDDHKISDKKFGNKVNEWIKKMLGKSVDGIWKVGISAAGKILGDAIEQYYGIKH